MLLRTEQDTELRNRVTIALNKHTPRQREVIHLRYYEECSILRIGKLTGMETKTIYNTIYSAMKTLSAELTVCLLDRSPPYKKYFLLGTSDGSCLFISR